MNFDEFVKQLRNVSAVEIAVFATGFGLLAYWLARTSFGTRSLVDSVPRRNNMPVYLPLLILVVWLGTISIIMSVSYGLLSDLPDWQNAFANNLVLCIGAIVSISVVIFSVRRYFARRLKGFGLNIKTIPRDFCAAILNLLSVYPVVGLVLGLTIYFGHLICGPDFQLQQHQELEMITLHKQLSLRVLVIIVASVVVPVFEEMLFRGLFQTMIRSFILKPWLSIVISSAFFALVHLNPEHWPALFALGLCLGYAYEKSGSLIRPIFIHSLFNTTSLIVTLNQ